MLPCFTGQQDDRLRMLGAPIPELQHDQWLAVHHEDRHKPAIKTMSQPIADLIGQRQVWFAGG